jgi:hypothetical protein
MSPDKWQSKDEWEKEETQRLESEEASRREREREAELRSEWEREEKQRRDQAVANAVLATAIVTGLVAIAMPLLLYIGLFALAWAAAFNTIKKLETVWIRWALHVIAPIAIFAAVMWLRNLGIEAFHSFEYGPGPGLGGPG